MKKTSRFSEPSALQAKQSVIRNLFARFPLICCRASPRSGGANAKRADSSTFQRSASENLARSSFIRACSTLTLSISTDPASPCLRTSLSLFLFNEGLNPPGAGQSLVFWDIESLLKCRTLRNKHWPVDNLFLLLHVPYPQRECAVHVRSCDNTRSFG